MATLQDYLGITKLRDAWPKWKANVIAVNNQIINHVAGTADKHAAQDITYSGSFTSKTDINAALDQAKTEIDLIVVSASIDPEVAFARVSAVKAKTFATIDARLEESEQDLVSYIDPEVALARASLVKAKTFATLDARLEESEQDLVSHKAETAIQVNEYGAIGDGADESGKIQDAIDYASSLSVNGSKAIVKFAHSKTYMVGNLQLKSNVILDLNGCTLKLLPNAQTYSVNGGIADVNGNYPSNVIGTTLIDTGGIWYDEGVRAKDENNSTYIVENCIIKNGTIDGNKLNNTLGNVGHNTSAMAEGIAIYQAKNVEVINCRLVDCGMDGIAIGYTLHGGSDYCKILDCYFEGNVRCGIAQLTGKYNEIAHCVIKHTGTGPGIDVEANFADEVNYRHNIHDNYIENGLATVCMASAKQFNITFANNVIVGSVSLSRAKVAAGSNFTNNILLGSGGNAFNLSGENYTTTDFEVISFIGNKVSGYDYIVGYIAVGGHGHYYFANNTFKSKYGFDLCRPYNIMFENNIFEFTGGDTLISAFVIRFGFSTIIPTQGKILLKGNKISGGGVGDILSIIRETEPPTQTKESVILEDNYIEVATNALNSFIINGEITFKRNKIKSLTKPIIFSVDTIDTQFINNEIEATTLISLTTFSAQCKNIVFKDNLLKNLNIDLCRPQNCIVDNNKLINGKITITYSFTSAGAGNNHFLNNTCYANVVIDYALHVITGGGFDVANFSSEDIFENNYHYGAFTARSYIAPTIPVFLGYNSWNKKVKWDAIIPAAGSWVVGDIVYNTVPTAGGYMGWTCITAGAPGTWKGFGLIETP